MAALARAFLVFGRKGTRGFAGQGELIFAAIVVSALGTLGWKIAHAPHPTYEYHDVDFLKQYTDYDFLIHRPDGDTVLRLCHDLDPQDERDSHSIVVEGIQKP